MLITSLNRVQVLQRFAPGGTCAEVGVYNGGFAAQIVRHCAPLKLYLIDAWGAHDDPSVEHHRAAGDLQDHYSAVAAMFEKDIESGRIVIHREQSALAARGFDDHLLDWVYLDASSSYEDVFGDLRAFSPKVAADGFLFGRGFSNTKVSRAKKRGVIPAVLDFVNETGFKLVLITNESAPSYLIAKDPDGHRCRDLIQSIIDANASVIDIDPKLIMNFQQFEAVRTGGQKVQCLQLTADPAPGAHSLAVELGSSAPLVPEPPKKPLPTTVLPLPVAPGSDAPRTAMESRRGSPLRSLLDDSVLIHDQPRPQLPVFYGLLTRFSMFLPQFRDTGRIQSEADFALWLKKRATIFAATCLPAVLGQIRRPDRWFIGFDETRRDQVGPVLDLIKPYPWIVPVWQRVIKGEHESARLVFVRAVAEALEPHHTFVLTSRLDNDDAISKMFCEAVDDYASAVVDKYPTERDFWISFPYGMQYDGHTFRIFPLNNNAFLSKFELARPFATMKGATALSGNHSRVFSKGRVFTPMSRSAMWLQIVHGSNVSNSSSSILSALSDDAAELKRFSIRPLTGLMASLAKAHAPG